MITRAKNPEIGLTVITCHGCVDTEQLVTAISELHDDANPTLYHLWDLIEADVTQVTGQDIWELALSPRDYGSARAGGKTALVCQEDVAFGLSNMYVALADLAELKVCMRAFRKLEDAYDWLVEPAPESQGHRTENLISTHSR